MWNCGWINVPDRCQIISLQKITKLQVIPSSITKNYISQQITSLKQDTLISKTPIWSNTKTKMTRDPDGCQRFQHSSTVPSHYTYYHIRTEGIPHAEALVTEAQNYTQEHSKNCCVWCNILLQRVATYSGWARPHGSYVKITTIHKNKCQQSFYMNECTKITKKQCCFT